MNRVKLADIMFSLCVSWCGRAPANQQYQNTECIKIWVLAIALLVDSNSSALQSRKWQLIGMS